MIKEKLLDDNSSENTIVHVIFRGKFNEEYECVGVLTKEDKGSIRVAFVAKNDNVTDYVDIKKAEVEKIDILKPSDIKEF